MAAETEPQAREIEEEWETVAEGIPTVTWEPAVNDTIEGTYTRVDVYRGADGEVVTDPAFADEDSSFSYAVIDTGEVPCPQIPIGYQLSRMLDKVSDGQRVRITYLGEQFVGTGKSGMRMYRVQVAKS